MPSNRPSKLSLKKKLQLRLKPLLNKLPHLLTIKMFLLRLMCAMTGLFLMTLFIARVPELHDSYIRSKVGGRVYELKVDPFSGGGTGFQLTAPSGTNYIVTNSHVCNYIQEHGDHGNVLVVDNDGSYVTRHVVAISDRSDLCLVEGMPDVSGLSLGNEAGVGDRMQVVGHPHLRPITLSTGEIIGFQDVSILDYIMEVKDNPFVALMVPTNPNGKCDLPKNRIESMPIPQEIGGGEVKMCITETKNTYETSIVIYPGNSGSPMVDFYGRVVGVAFASNSDDNYGNMVSLSDLQAFLAKY